MKMNPWWGVVKPKMTSKLRAVQPLRINLQDTWLLSRWCPAYKGRESDLGFYRELREGVTLMIRKKYKWQKPRVWEYQWKELWRTNLYERWSFCNGDRAKGLDHPVLYKSQSETRGAFFLNKAKHGWMVEAEWIERFTFRFERVWGWNSLGLLTK